MKINRKIQAPFSLQRGARARYSRNVPRKKLRGPGIGQRLKDLRTQLGWSQDMMSEKTGLRRTEISIIEQGRNKGTSFRVRAWLARGFGVSEEVLNAYWEGRLSPPEMAAR